MTKQQYVGKASACFIYLTVTMFWLIPAFGQTPSTALRFTADGQQVLVPHTDELDRINLGLTIESWVKPDASLLSRGYSSIVSKQMNGTGYMTASNMLGPEPGFKAEVAGIQVTSQSRPVAGIWQHIAAVWDYGQLKIYVNGQLNGVINADPPIPNTFPLWIGSSPFGADTNFRGDIDEVRIWAVARSQEEIQSTMNQYLCGDEIGLRAYWSFDEGSGQQVIDTLGRSNGSISGPVWVPGVQLSRRPCPQVSFVGPKTFPAGTNPVASVVGDFNRDGNKDLAVANRGSNNVSVLLGNGNGTLRTAVNFPVGGPPNSIVMGYFNGDSIQDLAVANANPNPSISVLLGNGNGTFQSALNFPAGASFTPSIDYGDFNGDHLWDLIVSTSSGFAVHLGNGNGTFQAPLNTGATGDYVAGYFNNDGILDVATAGDSGVFVLFGKGDGTFPTSVRVPLDRAVSIATGYLNRDAIADLAVTYRIGPSSFLSRGVILLGNGDGTFRSEGDFSTPLGTVVTVDDFDGDNIADLLIGGGDVSVQLGRGDGTFRNPALRFVFGGSSIVVGEFNSDGRKDLAATGFGGASLALGYGDGSFQTTWNYDLGGSQSISSPQPRPVESEILALGEFNGDGIKDLAVVHAFLGRLSVLLGNGDGSFRWAFDYNLGSPPGSISIAVGEFNGDGIQDLVMDIFRLNPTFNGVTVLLGNRNGTFQPPLDFPAAIPSNGYVAVGYFNADWYQDIAVLPSSGPSEGGISVLLGNGEGTFQAPLSFDTGVPLGSSRHVKRSLAVGDFNGDGSQDLVATNARSVSVLLGNGNGTFRAPLIFDTGGPGVVPSLDVGDFNNDHVQDLVVSIDDVLAPGFSILLGNGDGTFRLPAHVRLDGIRGSGAGSVAVGDFNRDGIHDLILGTAHYLSTGLLVLVGNGDATFQPPVSIGVGTTGASFAIGLLSGDGRPDIAIGACIPSPDDCFNRVSVLINNTP